MCYDYARMLKDIEMLTDNYNIIERFSIEWYAERDSVFENRKGKEKTAFKRCVSRT